MKINRETDIISRVLSPAIKLWLKSQVDKVEALEIKISGRDRQMLRGYVPSIFLASTRAIYQGIHLSAVEVNGENIRINLGQILRGQSLRLLEPIAVKGKVLLEEEDLNNSLTSPLLSSGLTDLLLTLLEESGIEQPQSILKSYQIFWQTAAIDSQKFSLQGTIANGDGEVNSLILRSGLSSVNGQTLRLAPLHIQGLPATFSPAIEELEVDLGSQVEIAELTLASGQLFCSGSIIIIAE